MPPSPHPPKPPLLPAATGSALVLDRVAARVGQRLAAERKAGHTPLATHAMAGPDDPEARRPTGTADAADTASTPPDRPTARS